MMTKRLSWLPLVCGLVACGGNTANSSPTPPPGTQPGQPMLKAPGDAKIGDTTRCPVTGEEFIVSANSPKTEYKGDTYYFCCSGCKKKFEENPEKYLHPTGPMLKGSPSSS